MRTSDTQPTIINGRRQSASRRSRMNAVEVPELSRTLAQQSLTNSASLLNRLQKSLPARKESKVYSPSLTLPYGNNGVSRPPEPIVYSTERVSSPTISLTRRARTHTTLSSTRSSSLDNFEQKYAADDPLMRYVLHILRTSSPVIHSEIPRGKRMRRKEKPEQDVLYLIYCETPPCGFRNVYWLTLADEGKVLCNDDGAPLEYFTLGSHGITRFKGGQGIEFSDLASWVDEKRAFDHMTKMESLQLMIFFFSWKRQAVQRRRRRIQERLACSLFTCHPIAANLLMAVRVACTDIEREAVLDYVESSTSYTIEGLKRILCTRLDRAKAAVASRICALCGDIDMATRNIPHYQDGESNYAITDRDAFSKSLRLTSLRERMFTFLRLVDYHVSEAVYQHYAYFVRDIGAQICGLRLLEPPHRTTPTTPSVARRHMGIERDTCLLRLQSPVDTVVTSLTVQIEEHVEYSVRLHIDDVSVASFPRLYVRLMEDVDFEDDGNSASMRLSPTKIEVLELVHHIFVKYSVAMDELPRVLTDSHFDYVLTPFVPAARREFIKSLLKPSLLVLESNEAELRQMRASLDIYFRHVGVLQQEHLRCVRAIKVAKSDSHVNPSKSDDSSAFDDDGSEDIRLPELPDLSTSAAAYELAQETWSRFVQYANTAAPMLQIGFLLLDQRSFVEKLRCHVSKSVVEMDDALPTIYQQFITSLLNDIDGRIEKVTKIPTNLDEASTWIMQVTSMMATHPFRQRLNAKCTNLARLRVLVKERVMKSLDAAVQDSIRKLELKWESVIETLLLCLSRVEERGSEHRRSVQEVVVKVEEHITGQLQILVAMFERLPSGCEEGPAESNKRTDDAKKDEIVQRLEDLVAMDLERKSVEQQFDEYDREHRALMELPPLQQTAYVASNSAARTAIVYSSSMRDKLPSELLLQYIVTSLELRHWYESWNKLRDKWLNSPVASVHPGTMINRIKQFRRRLGYASSRLSRLSSALKQSQPFALSGQIHQISSQEFKDEGAKEPILFAKKDFDLMLAFDGSIEEMLNCNQVFQAISGGGFTEARWTAMHQLLGAEVPSKGNQLTLRRMKEKCSDEQIEAVMVLCDECIVEAKFHAKVEQARQRLARIEVQVEETNYSVRCEGLEEVLAQLDEIAVEIHLCLFGQNPELQQCLELVAELERKVDVCEHILTYQKQWRLRCEATKLHEVDEFFSKRFSGNCNDEFYSASRPRKMQQKSGMTDEKAVWQAFLDASHAWSDRLRRLFFVSTRLREVQEEHLRATRENNSAGLISSAFHQRQSTTKTIKCTLDGIITSFDGFDFETNFAACERGKELILAYVDSLREKSPRLYCLDEMILLKLLLRDSKVLQLHQTLAILFPRVHRFAVMRAAHQVGLVADSSTPIIPVRASDTDGTIIISGIEEMHGAVDLSLGKSGQFRLPVAKIGRINFWFTRLEEEMASMVRTDLKRAFEWVVKDLDTTETCDYLLPQSIGMAYMLRFTYEMNCAMRPGGKHRLHQLQMKVTERLRGHIAARHSKKAIAMRLEILLLLTTLQSEVLHHVIDLSENGQQEEALFFWNLQLQTRVFMETISTPGAATHPTSGKLAGGRQEKNELLPTSPDFLKVPSSSPAGQTTTLSVYCQVAHLHLPLGQEFVGWERFAVLSPLTQRCCYALFSAMKMHHTGLAVPYGVQQAGNDPTPLLRSIGQILMRPCIEVSCNPSAGVTTIRYLSNLLNAVTKLGGILIIRHILQLSPMVMAVMKERILQHFHQSVSHHSSYRGQHQQSVMTSLVLPRQREGLVSGASAIFIPLDSAADAQRSGLLQSIRTQFRAIAVARPAIRYVVECLLTIDGFTTEQIRETNVVLAFEALATFEMGNASAGDVQLLIPRVVQEARRLRESYRIVQNPHPSASPSSMKSLSQSHSTNSSGDIESFENQCIFRRAVSTIVPLFLADKQNADLAVLNDRVESVVANAFPLSNDGRLVPKNRGDEEAVAAAVSIFLESTFSHTADCEQFEIIMGLWRALHSFPAALVYGNVGSGKTTCITALHRALVALELSEINQETEEGNRVSQVKPPPTLTQLVILNPCLLTLEQFYNNVAVACGAGTESESATKTSKVKGLRWVLVDGEVDGIVLERLLGSDNRACASLASLPSSAVLYRSTDSCVLSTDCLDPENSPRLLFETINLVSLSPLVLCSCWALHVPERIITVSSIIHTWRARWEKQVSFPSESRGTEAMAIIFKTVDILISNICVQFAVDEVTHDQIGKGPLEKILRLGYLSLNQITTSALSLVAHCCFPRKSLLLDLPSSRIVDLVAFAVLWGFAGHLVEPIKHKLELYVRSKCKEYSETKHLAELRQNLLDASHLDDIWDELQPKLAGTLSFQPTSGAQFGAKRDVRPPSAFDCLSGQLLVLSPAATSLIRICTQLLRSSQSFLLIGPAATGKTSLLRWIVHRNSEDEAAEMKIETSLDEHHMHGILDWMRVPAAWFRPLNQRGSATASRAKVKEETELFAGRARHSFLFLDDLDAGGQISGEAQIQFIRAMLDHRLGFSSKNGVFQPLDKQVGATMRIYGYDFHQDPLPPPLIRLMRHFAVFRVPTYTPTDLLSIFRVKFQTHFKWNTAQENYARRYSSVGEGAGGGGQQLALEEVVLRASVNFAAEVLSLQQISHVEHPCLFAFNLHLLNMLLERTLASTADIKSTANSVTSENEGTTLVMLGKAHQAWLSELQNIFLSNCPAARAAAVQTTKHAGSTAESFGKSAFAATGEELQKKLDSALRHISEKYFSVALRGSSAGTFSVAVETLHFIVEFASHHVQAPLLHAHLGQIREYMNEHMNAGNGDSRRSSDQSGNRMKMSVGGNGGSFPAQLSLGLLLEMTSASLDSHQGRGKLTALETKLVLGSSWCLKQTMHLVHALRRQQQVVVSLSSEHGGPLQERFLRFACDLHGFKVHVVGHPGSNGGVMNDEHQKLLHLALAAAGIRQERVALWVRQRNLDIPDTDDTAEGNCLGNILEELCLNKLPSFAMLPGGEELRKELVLSCIQSRSQLEIVTEAELMTEFQYRLQQNLRLCILEENDTEQTGLAIGKSKKSVRSSSLLVRWMKTRPSCHWRRLDFTEYELQHLLPEMATAALDSAAVAGGSWNALKSAKYVALFQSVHWHVMRASPAKADPVSQLSYYLSFLVNLIETYRAKLAYHYKKITRLEESLDTLRFARKKVVPALEQLQKSLEAQCAYIDSELMSTSQQEMADRHETIGTSVNDQEAANEMSQSPGQEEAVWVQRARYEELSMMSSESRLRLDQVLQHLTKWQQVANRVNNLSDKWAEELELEKDKSEHELMESTVFISAQRAYGYVTGLDQEKRSSLFRELREMNFGVTESNSEACLDTHVESLVEEVNTDETIGLVRHVWTSRFHFLRDQEIYRTIRSADELCDRIPVIVDPSGVVQRFFVHFFSGHTLFSSPLACGSADESEKSNSILTKDSMVVSCDDPKLENLLNEAQNLALPVLLVNFRTKDKNLLGRLQPFLDRVQVSHVPLRRPVLRELTLKSYEAQHKQKSRRPSTAGPTVAAIAPSNTSGLSAALMVRCATKTKAMAREVMSVTVAANPETSATQCSPGLQNPRVTCTTKSESKPNFHEFQIYAVSTTPVLPRDQHDLAAQFAFFFVKLPDSECKALFASSQVAKHHQPLVQEINSGEVGLADCWIKKLQTQGLLERLLKSLKPAVADLGASPFSRPKPGANSALIQIEQQECFSELFTQIKREQRTELIWSSRKRELQLKYAELSSSTEQFAPTSLRLAGIARCMTVMSSLMLGERLTPFYLHSYRYLESVAKQQLTVQDDAVLQLSDDGLTAVLSRISSGFVSESHLNIFRLLVTFQNQSAVENIEDELQKLATIKAVTWLISSSVCGFAHLKHHNRNHLGRDGDLVGLETQPGRRNSFESSVSSGASLVERLRQRVKLCAYLFSGWTPSRGIKNARSRAHKASRLLSQTSAAISDIVQSSLKLGMSENTDGDDKDLAILELQGKTDRLLSSSETLWYEWKTNKGLLLSDVKHLLSDLGFEEVSSRPGADRNAILSSARVLVSMEDMLVSFGLDKSVPSPGDRIDPRQRHLASLLLAKTFLPVCFADYLQQYLYQYGYREDTALIAHESWTALPPSASIVADIAPARGKNNHAHLPRALIIYFPEDSNEMALKLADVDVTVFVDVDAEDVVLREDLVHLITSKRRFVLELLDAKHAESAFSLMSNLINQHALLSVPEWYLLASFDVATSIENGKMTVLDRIALPSMMARWKFHQERDRDRPPEVHVKLMLEQEFCVPNRMASTLTEAVITRHGRGRRFSDGGSVIRSLGDLGKHCSLINHVATDNVDHQQMLEQLLLLTLHGKEESCPKRATRRQVDAVQSAHLSFELLNDLVSIGWHFQSMDEQQPILDGEAACKRLWASVCDVSGHFQSLGTISRSYNYPDANSNSGVQFFPWQSFDDELAAQSSAFEGIKLFLMLLCLPSASSPATNTRVPNRQQQITSLARGYIPFHWIESFFEGTGWPAEASGIIAIAQLQLLVACRVGVLVRCLRGDRAWALNLAVVSDACGFLRNLRAYVANRINMAESTIKLVLEQDASTDVGDGGVATEDNDKKKKSLIIAKHFASICDDDAPEDDWHGAVLHRSDGGVESWGVRVDGLVLVEQYPSPLRTKLHPLPLCRIMCQPLVETRQLEDVPIVILPSLSPYQPAPNLSQGPDALHVLISHAIYSTLDLGDTSSISESSQRFAVGIPVFPDDDNYDSS